MGLCFGLELPLRVIWWGKHQAWLYDIGREVPLLTTHPIRSYTTIIVQLCTHTNHCPLSVATHTHTLTNLHICAFRGLTQSEWGASTYRFMRRATSTTTPLLSLAILCQQSSDINPLRDNASIVRSGSIP